MKILTLFNFILANCLIMATGNSTLQSCFQEQLRLKAQVRLLEYRVKQQQVKIVRLLQEKEIQYHDNGDENSVIDLGEKRQYAADCAEIYNDGHKRSGFYKMKPLQSPSAFLAYCDMSEGGGWTVFQRRSDGSQKFDRVWDDYEQGFGNFVLRNGEYWLGNKNLHYLTDQGNYTLRIDLSDFEGVRRFAQYKSFRVAGEEVSHFQPEWCVLQRTLYSKDRQWNCLVHMAWVVVFSEICCHEGLNMSWSSLVFMQDYRTKISLFVQSLDRNHNTEQNEFVSLDTNYTTQIKNNQRNNKGVAVSFMIEQRTLS
nr:fibrinogen-like protein 1 isoform X3 [Chrysemys picta bellii]